MKVLLNRCYGGFSISEDAARKLVLTKCPHRELPEIPGEKFYGGGHRDKSARSCEFLIALAEQEDISGELAKLKVVEVPDGINWEIDDYDGIETVEEDHRRWA